MTSKKIERKLITYDSWIEVLPWRNDPLVYTWNRTNRPISLLEHISWFDNRQGRLKYEPVFSYHDDVDFVGIARLDELSELNYEVSLMVNPVFRGKGFGKRILSDVCEYFSSVYPKESTLTAVIHSQNTRSQKLFHALNFKFMSEENDFKTYTLTYD